MTTFGALGSPSVMSPNGPAVISSPDAAGGVTTPGRPGVPVWFR